MTLEQRIKALAQSIGADIKSLLSSVGSLSGLTTSAKTSLVAAINEVKGLVGNPVSYAQVNTYQDMLNIGTPNVLTIVLVANDEDKIKPNQKYDLFPNGIRLYKGENDKLVNYTLQGTPIYDGHSPYGEDQSVNYTKVFDGNADTYFHSGNNPAWVGLDLGSAQSVNTFILRTVRDTNNATSLNGAQVQYSQNGSSWTNIGNAVSSVTSTNYDTPVNVGFASTSARYWRILLNAYGYLAELQILYVRP